ncbi:LamG domain-containing protein [Candidatus Woesearchaeota archaeon]|nr:MAG: LamG domain-containing protein [Candidatus Woesearchaeota archaeon]
MRKATTLLIIIVLLSTAVLGATSAPVRHVHVVTSENPTTGYTDKNTAFTGAYCSGENTGVARAYFEFDTQELNQLEEKPYYYFVVKVSQLADNVCQSRKKMEYLELYSVSDAEPEQKITWNTQPSKTGRHPLDAKLIRSDSVYYFQIPSDALEQMKSKRRPMLLVAAVDDMNTEFISVKELQKNARIEARDLPIVYDTDGDGLDDVIEAQLGTDITNPDSDGDGIKDFKEALHGLNPVKKDVEKQKDIQSDCSNIRCPTGIACVDGVCLVPTLRDEEIKEKAREIQQKPESCFQRGGEICTLEQDCDGYWASEINENCCFGSCVTEQDCVLLPPSIDKYEVEQGDAVKITITGVGCEGNSVKVKIKEMDGIGSEDDITAFLLPTRIRNGKAEIIWTAEGYDDGLFGGRNEYKICAKAEGSREACAKNYVKVKQHPKEKTCAAGDGCNIECALEEGDPDCLCIDLLEKKAEGNYSNFTVPAYICDSYDECSAPLLSSEGICCASPCVRIDSCGNGVCESVENDVICPADCKIGEPRIFTLKFDGSLTSEDGQGPAATTGGEFSDDAVSGMSLYGIADDEYIDYANQDVFYGSQGSVALWVKFDAFTSEDSAYFHTPDSKTVLYYDYCVGCTEYGKKLIKARVGGIEARYEVNPEEWVGKWHHIAMTWKGAPAGIASLYVDGILADRIEYTEASGASSFRIGNNYGLWMGWHDGKMDNMHIANYKMSDEEIAEIYYSEKPNSDRPGNPCKLDCPAGCNDYGDCIAPEGFMRITDPGNPERYCLIEDYGDSIYEKGKLYYTDWDQEMEAYVLKETEDRCLDEHDLWETRCFISEEYGTFNVNAGRVSCPAGCNDGACNHEDNNQEFCEDSDGLNYYTRGTTIAYNNQQYLNKTDTCINRNTVTEYACDGNTLYSVEHQCGNQDSDAKGVEITSQCVDGACIFQE